MVDKDEGTMKTKHILNKGLVMEAVEMGEVVINKNKNARKSVNHTLKEFDGFVPLRNSVNSTDFPHLSP